MVKNGFKKNKFLGRILTPTILCEWSFKESLVYSVAVYKSELFQTKLLLAEFPASILYPVFGIAKLELEHHIYTTLQSS